MTPVNGHSGDSNPSTFTARVLHAGTAPVSSRRTPTTPDQSLNARANARQVLSPQGTILDRPFIAIGRRAGLHLPSGGARWPVGFGNTTWPPCVHVGPFQLLGCVGRRKRAKRCRAP